MDQSGGLQSVTRRLTDYLLKITHGHPYLTQAVAKELVDLLNDEKRQVATFADIKRAAQNATQAGQEYFYNLWDDAEQDGQILLKFAAKGGNAPTGATRTHLREMDIFDDEGRFAVPLFEDGVKTKMLDT
jgi:hypothetical protein